ncbi:hypothetical protein LY71_101334 [Geodermatophilus tzadiensis]|uniref:Uncharacterized protein n=1 Tax=Geodermatophilus tzadiensis TaxID=1137988 RepID=A0A2T0U208_9ACTN|nr:hypothetical protein [Geodermatophilus tzadiensis]PRY51962.1 hypothetical protein LY71_101334 [Geodermatophilus tzadiensis]
MTERDPSSGQVGAGEQRDWREQTTPGLSPAATGGYGSPGTGENPYLTPDRSTEPVAVRGPDSLGGLLCLLAGIAAAVSLALSWLREPGDIGWDLVVRGFDEFGSGFGTLVDSGFWQPLAVVLGGGVLLLLGLLMWLPARTHRFLGVVALFVSLLALAAVLVPLASEEWDPAAFRLGFWFACAVSVLGLLGALKAMLTGRRYARR